MAVELLVPYLRPDEGAAAVAQVRAEHRALYRGTGPAVADGEGVWHTEPERVAAESGDPHQVKLVEACRRGFARTGDPAFVAAADVVTGRSHG